MLSRVGKQQEATLSYEMALPDDGEGTTTAQLAKLYLQDDMHTRQRNGIKTS